jgi:hypothetical protein
MWNLKNEKQQMETDSAANMLIIDCSTTFKTSASHSGPFTKNKLTFIIPINWKASVPFKTFIARREEYRNGSNSPSFTGSRLECSKSSIGSIEKPPNKESHHKIHLVATAANKEIRDPYDTNRILEIQKRLLQRLARKENAIKGLVDEDGERKASRDSPTVADVEEWKGGMAQALHAIWGCPRLRRL